MQRTLAILIATLAILAAPPVLAGEPPASLRGAWPATDFSRSSIDIHEIMSGGPPRDGIPAITGPEMIAVSAETRLDPREAVMSLAMPGEAPRAYPLRYLMWHEIVNDVVGGVPIAVTFCPLCNSGSIFDRRVGGRVLEFGVSGLLRYSNLVMFDRETDSLWQQFFGEAIVGELTGTRLTPLPALLESWESFAARNPDGLVMDQPRGYARSYGQNPYTGYDSAAWPFLYRGDPPPDGIDAMARVIRIGDRAWPMARIAEAGTLTEAGYRIEWSAGQASALDTGRLGAGREVGNIRVFDAATGAPVVHEIIFAFVFQAFEPEGTWMTGG